MAKKKIVSYTVRWSMSCCDHGGKITVDAEDVAGMSCEVKNEYFQQLVDDEVNINGPFGHVDSVEEVKWYPARTGQ